MQIFKNLLLQNHSTNSPWICVINACTNGGATYIIGEIIVKGNVNIAYLMQIFEN